MKKKTATPIARKKTAKTRETAAQVAARERFSQRRHTTTVAILMPTWDHLVEVAARARDRGAAAPSMNLAINALLKSALSNEKTAIATIRAAGEINLPPGRKA